MVYVGYCLFSSCGVHASVGEVLGSLGSGIIRYLDIAWLDFEDISIETLGMSKSIMWSI